MISRSSALFGLVAAAGIAAWPAAASATTLGGGADNVVALSEVGNQPPASRAQLQIAYASAPNIGNDNISSALARDCTGCRVGTAAVQIVLVESPSPSLVAPLNSATAGKADCNGCSTFAFAYQDVIWVARPVALGAGAIARLNLIEGQMSSVVATAYSPAQAAAQLNSLSQEAVSIVNADLASAGASPLSQSAHEQAQAS